MSLRSVSLKKYGLSRIHALPNRIYLITHSTSKAQDEYSQSHGKIQGKPLVMATLTEIMARRTRIGREKG